MHKQKYLLLIVGPTAVGKTRCCIRLSKKFNADIFSFDSRQFYREINIGTAKPSPKELNAVPHHFINNKSISEIYTAAQFEEEILQALAHYFKERDIAIATGGSGFFARAISHGFDPIPDIQAHHREAIAAKYAEDGLKPLLKELETLDPETFSTIDRNNAQRVIRALEVSKFSGKAFSAWHGRQPKERPFEIVKIGLERPREDLYGRINERVDTMIEAGLEDEVRSVLAFRNHNALQTVGYKEFFAFFDGKTSFEETVSLIKQNTRRYAKRQLTWFKNKDDFRWCQPDKEDEIVGFIQNSLRK